MNVLKHSLRVGVRRVPLARPAFMPPLAIRTYSAPAGGEYEHILTSEPKPGVGMITLNRPKKLNALSTPLFTDLNRALTSYAQSPSIGAIVLTGSHKAFAAGADIAEMAPLTFGQAYGTDFIKAWSDVTTSLPKPLIAAVNGFALGGGCELAMMADIIYCSSSAQFGQPEITLGTIPGAGGSQRLTRAIGKSKAMEMVLTGRFIDGATAERWGLAARCYDGAEECVDGAVAAAAKIAGFSRVAVKAAKEVVGKSQELGLRDGVEFERRVFHGLFGSRDQKVGMEAFVKKEKNPTWENV